MTHTTAGQTATARVKSEMVLWVEVRKIQSTGEIRSLRDLGDGGVHGGCADEGGVRRVCKESLVNVSFDVKP